jgi:hypothetical protein
MSGVKYRLHFTLLLFAAAMLYFAFNSSQVSAAIAGWRFDAYFASVGLLHAVALVLALRVSVPFIRRLVFVLMATVLSFAAPIVGPAFVAVIGLQNDAGLFSALAAASAGERLQSLTICRQSSGGLLFLFRCSWQIALAG